MFCSCNLFLFPRVNVKWLFQLALVPSWGDVRILIYSQSYFFYVSKILGICSDMSTCQLLNLLFKSEVLQTNENLMKCWKVQDLSIHTMKYMRWISTTNSWVVMCIRALMLMRIGSIKGIIVHANRNNSCDSDVLISLSWKKNSYSYFDGINRGLQSNTITQHDCGCN